jgi:cytochrome c-type biogenesis protein CcmH/NrfG
MRTALRIDPANLSAAANLATFLRLTGSVEGGEALLQRIVEANPDAVPARLNLAANLLQEDRAEEALALLASPPPAEPRALQQWHLH